MSVVLPNEVFLSHSSLDRQFAGDLSAVIGRHGVPVWYSQTNILGAQQWQDEIGAALQRCDWFAVVLSPQSADSNRIIPVVYQQSDFERLSWTLSLFQMVDFTQNLEQGYRDLLRMWGLGYQR